MKYLFSFLIAFMFTISLFAQSISNELSTTAESNHSHDKSIKELRMVKPSIVPKDGEEGFVIRKLPFPLLNSKFTNEDVNRIEVGISAHQRPFRREEAKLISYHADLDVISVTMVLDPSTYPEASQNGIVGQLYSTDHGQTWEGPVILANDVSEGANYYISGAIYNPTGNSNINNVIGVYQGAISPSSGDWRFKSFGHSKWSGLDQQNYIYEETDPDYGYNGYWNFFGLQQFGNQMRCMNPKPTGEWSEFTDIDLEIISADYNNGSFDWTNSTIIDFDLYNNSEDGIVHWMGNWNGNDSGFEIAWSNDGEIGYAWIVGVDENISSGFQPLIYKTENAGESWTSINLDFTTSTIQTYLSSYLVPTYNGLYIPYTIESVGAVNINGELEIFASLGSTIADIFVHRDSAYYRSEIPSDLFNLTINSSGISDISHITKFNTMNVPHNEEGSYCGSQGWQHRLFVTKSPDETQIMLTWIDTQDGDMNEYNFQPDIYGWAKYNYNGNSVTSENPICFTESTLYEGFYYFTCASEFAFENESGNYTIPYMQAVTPSEFVANTSTSGDAVTMSYVTGIEMPKLGNGVLDLAIVEVSPNNQYVSSDEVFETTVEISEVTDLGGFEINLDFDPNYLQANSVTLESFLGSTGRQVFPLNNSIDNTNGLIEFAATTLGATPPGASGDGILLSIEWTSAAVSDAVTTAITIENLQITEPNGVIIPAETTNATVVISNCFPYDFDCDCDVDIVDVTMAAYAYGTSIGDPNYDATYDLDNDGDIDIVDITMVTYNYGWECDGKSTSVQEFENDLNQNVDLIHQELYKEKNDKELLVNIKDIHQFGAYELTYTYNPNHIEIVSVEDAQLLTKTGREAIKIKSDIDTREGLVNIAYSSLGSQVSGIDGDGQLLSIKYKKKSNSLDQDFELVRGQLTRIDAQLIPFKSIYDIKNEYSNQMGVVPNPNNGEFTLNYQTERNEEYTISLISYTGFEHVIVNEKMHNVGSHKLQVSNLDLVPGIYLLKLESQNHKTVTKKMIVQ